MGGGASSTSGHFIQISLQKLTPTITVRSHCNSTSHDAIEDCLEDFSIESTVVKSKFPFSENYLTEKCTMSELEQANKARLHLNTLPHYIEFDNVFFKILNEECTDMPFVVKPFCYKKQFVVELMRLLTCSCNAGFEEKLVEFVLRRRSESIVVEDCKYCYWLLWLVADSVLLYNIVSISLLSPLPLPPLLDGLLGQVFLDSINVLRSEEEGRLWAKAYSRFLRALLSQGNKLDLAVQEERTVSLG